MSWLSKAIGGIFKSPVGQVALPLASVALPGVGGLAAKGIGALGAAKKVLPGVGMVAGGTAAGTYLAEKFSGTSGKRRRGKGFSARDVRQTKRMMKMLKEVQGACPKPRTTSARRSCSCQ